MKDVFFNDYKGDKKSSNSDTGKIPITEIERKRQEEIKKRRYEEIVRKQQQNKTDEYRENTPRNVRVRRAQDYQPNSNQNYTYLDEYEEQYYQKPTVRRAQPQKTPENVPQKKKRGCGCTSAITSLFLVFVILCGLVFGYVYLMSSKTNLKKTTAHITAYDIMSDPQIYNILLIGSDKADEDGTARSDSMILLSVDNKHKKLKFTSFMRDMWVTIPGYGDAKLNAAYAHGGASLLIETIENTFKIKIDNYATVNFSMFESVIDGLGGVEVDITEAEAEFINSTTHAKVSPGLNTLNGDYALIYCRIRKLDSDFNRTQRQRKVIAAIFKKVQQKPLSLAASAGDVLENITTDISPLKMTLKVFGAPMYLTYGNDQLRLPVDGEYEDQMVDGQAALVIDFIANINAVQDFIYE